MTPERHWLFSRLLEPSAAAVWFVDEDADDALEDAARHGLSVHRAELRAPVTKESVLAAVSGALAFPEYFGDNWDALDDCLRDLSWLAPGGIVLVVDGSRAAWHSAPAALGGLVSAWLEASAAWSEEERPLHLVFRG